MKCAYCQKEDGDVSLFAVKPDPGGEWVEREAHPACLEPRMLSRFEKECKLAARAEAAVLAELEALMGGVETSTPPETGGMAQAASVPVARGSRKGRRTKSGRQPPEETGPPNQLGLQIAADLDLPRTDTRSER